MVAGVFIQAAAVRNETGRADNPLTVTWISEPTEAPRLSRSQAEVNAEVAFVRLSYTMLAG
jgi:hypothetical protein